MRPYWPLLACVLGALAIRLLVLGFVHPICEPQQDPERDNCFGLTGDTEYVVVQARELRAGHGFVDAGRLQFGLDGHDRPGATHPPLYTVVMAAWQQAGINSLHGWRVAMSLVGSVGVGLLGLAAWRLAAVRDGGAVATTGQRSKMAGTLAAGIGALNPLLWTRDTDLLVEALLIPLIGGFVVLTLRLLRDPSSRNASLLGVLVGIAWLARSEQILLLVGIAPIFLVGLRALEMRQRLARFLLAGLVAASCMAPWSIYNQARFERPVPLSTNGGLALLFGSCDDTYYGDAFAYYDWYCVESLPIEADVDASVADNRRLHAAIEYITDRPERTAFVATARLGRLWRVYAPVDTTRREAIQEDVGTPGAWANLAALYLLAPLGVVGAVALRRSGAPISALLAPIAISSLAAFVLLPLPRFRVPADAAIVVLAAFGVLWLRDRVGGDRVGGDRAGSDRAGSNRVGRDSAGDSQETTLTCDAEDQSAPSPEAQATPVPPSPQ